MNSSFVFALSCVWVWFFSPARSQSFPLALASPAVCQQAQPAIPAKLRLILEAELEETLKYGECPEFAANITLLQRDLNKDGRPEFVVQGRERCTCSATGNCFFRIYAKTSDGFRELFADDNVQTFRFDRHRSKGFSDLVTSMHGSAFDSDFARHQFNGLVYDWVESWCESSEYAEGADGKSRLKSRKVTAGACRSQSMTNSQSIVVR